MEIDRIFDVRNRHEIAKIYTSPVAYTHKYIDTYP